ncbi:MAG TPA: hypothetical protein VGO11_19365 [Chthoniobacteraceae bacterium]|jgi:hypothetical protein|nr:hypothetical protein [Chthoniobacteraceae bacterium]
MKRRKKKRRQADSGWSFGPEKPQTPQQFWAGTVFLAVWSLIFLGLAVTIYTEERFQWRTGARRVHSTTVTEASHPQFFGVVLYGSAALGVLGLTGVALTIRKRHAREREAAREA